MRSLTLILAIFVGSFLACDSTSKSKKRVTNNPTPHGKSTNFDFLEIISAVSTDRWVTSKNGSLLTYELHTAGNSNFEQHLPVLEFQHSVMDILPPVLPDGKIARATLDLKFIRKSGKFVSASIESIAFEKAQRKLFLIEPEMGDLVEISSSILADGLLDIQVTGQNGVKFVLKESVFRVEYQVTEEKLRLTPSGTN